MAKYIDADKLKTEIERLRSEAEYERCESFGNHDGFIINEAKEYICMLLKSFIDSLQQEQPEVDLDAIVNEAFDKYSSVDGYGQLSVSFNRAELYSFIKKIARKEE